MTSPEQRRAQTIERARDQVVVRDLDDGLVELTVPGGVVVLSQHEARQLGDRLRGERAACPRCSTWSREALVARSCGSCGHTWSTEGSKCPVAGSSS